MAIYLPGAFTSTATLQIAFGWSKGEKGKVSLVLMGRVLGIAAFIPLGTVLYNDFGTPGLLAGYTLAALAALAYSATLTHPDPPATP